jgi:hypothetical protein
MILLKKILPVALLSMLISPLVGSSVYILQNTANADVPGFISSCGDVPSCGQGCESCGSTADGCGCCGCGCEGGGGGEGGD